MTEAEALERAKSKVGVGALAKACGVTREAIYMWKRVPIERVLVVEAASGIPRYRLRPDIYPPPRRAKQAPIPERITGRKTAL